MELSIWMTALVCAGVFLGGLIDSMAGGGGLITLPIYFMSGLPAHTALATNKLSACCGTTLASFRFAKNKCVDWRYAVPGIVLAVLGATVGANLVLLLDDRYLRYLMVVLLPVIAVVVLRDKNMDAPEGTRSASRTALMFALVFLVGVYDGFYGPGTGTFLMLILSKIGRMEVRTATGVTKWMNLASNVGSLFVFLRNGQGLLWLGLLAGMFSIAGSYIGSGLVLKRGAKAVRPVTLIVLAILFVKIIWDFF